ncbi:MAG: hypothetical protein CL661_01590 [Bacteroidetes bacterium]|nr:hypothetical protein [Bacteroidota bacterium]
MKRLLSILILTSLISITSYAQISSNGTGGGNWNSTSTWSEGIIPTTEDVTIQASDIVSISTTQTCKELTIGSSATLQLQTSVSLTTSQSLTAYGTLTVEAGTLTVGDSKSDKLLIPGGTFNFSGGTINVAGSYKQNLTGAEANLSGSGIINISTIEVLTASTINNFSVTGACTFSVSSGSTVQIIIKNGNSSTKEEINYSPGTSNFDGGSIIIENGSSLTELYIDSDMPIYNIESKAGTGNTLHFDPDCDFSLTDLTITSGKVQVDVGANINITGIATLGEANALVIQSNSTGNGSLIASGTVTGTATVERYIEAYSGSSDGWHHISSPIDNMVIDGSDFDPGTNDDLYAWSESDNQWLNHKIGANNITNFTNGYGYLVAYESTATKDFTGSMNTSDVSFSNLSVGDGSGWHLLGNPFTSALQWKNGDWSMTDIGGVCKVWNETAGNYTDVSADEYIPSTNGFFIQAANATNAITIPASACVHNSQNNYKSGRVDVYTETLIVTVSNDQNAYYDKSIIGFKNDVTEEWDIEFDSRKLTGNEEAPQIWTTVSGEGYSTNLLPHVIDSYVLPLHFQAGSDGNYEFSFEGLESFYLNSYISLEDKFTGNITDLNVTPFYSFSAITTDASDRFLLHFFGVTNLDETSVDINTINIYSNNNCLYVKSYSDYLITGKILVYDIHGQKVFEDQMENTKHYFKTLELQRGHYVVHLITDHQAISKKVYLTQQTR